EAEGVDLPDGVVEREAAPGALAELVGVVVNEPVCVELAGNGRFSREDALPVEGDARTVRDVGGEMFDAQHAAADESFDGRRGAVCGSIVHEIDLNALVNQVADDLLDDVRFVIRR